MATPVQAPNKTSSQYSFLLRIALCSILLVAFAEAGHAQGTFVHDGFLFDNSADCQLLPTKDRAMRADTIRWNGRHYLFVDQGNELTVWNIDSPLQPQLIAQSAFDIGNQGDYDYDLVNFSVCDNCRWGIANYRLATVLFDLGEGADPAFESFAEYPDAALGQGGFTFSMNGGQYLVASELGDSCPSTDAGLYEFHGTAMAGNPRLECIDKGGSGIRVANGVFLSESGVPYVVLGEYLGTLGLYRVDATVDDLSLTWVSAATYSQAFMRRSSGFDADESAGLAVTAHDGLITVYDIGWDVGTPASPQVLASWAETGVNLNAAALRFPMLWVAQMGGTTTSHTFDLTDPETPQALDQDFWDPANPWNDESTCDQDHQMVFSQGGSGAFFTRFSLIQTIDTSAVIPGIFANGFEGGLISAWTTE